MIILNTTTDKLQVLLGGAVTTNQLNCLANYRDITTTAYTPGRTLINTNGATPVDVVGSPSASTQRVVDFISVFNADTANAEVTVRFNDNGTTYILFKTTLSTNEKLEYSEGTGFRVFANSGAVKTTVNQGNNATASTLSTVVLGNDVVNDNASANTIADVTGLSFPVVSGNTYYFRFSIFYESAASTTGSRWSVNGPTTDLLSFRSTYSLAATTQTQINSDTYDLPAASNATSISGQGNTAIIEGFIKPSANGTVIARFASEISGSAITAKAGSLVNYQQVL